MVSSCWRLREGHWKVFHVELIGVLTDVVEQFLSLLILFSPVSHIVSGSTLLQSLQDLLVLHGDLHQLSLPSVSVQTFTSHHAGVSLSRAIVELTLMSTVFSIEGNISDVGRLVASSMLLLLQNTSHLL